MSTTEQQANTSKTLVAAFYAFRPLTTANGRPCWPTCQPWQRMAVAWLARAIAKEGVNGTISGPKATWNKFWREYRRR